MRIRTENLQKRYGKNAALDGVDLEIRSGEIVTLLGPNGAGKTTLLRCLSGMVIPSAGRIFFDDERFGRDQVEQRRRLHFMPDEPEIFPMETVLRNLSIMLHWYGRDGDGMERRVIGLLKELEILPLLRRKMNELSRGQKYKAALVGLIAADPDVWMLDEPFASGMDPLGINAFKRHATEAVKRGRTIIYSTQILDIAERFSDRACVIDKGKLAALAPISELKNRPVDADEMLSRLFMSLREDDREVGTDGIE